MSALTGRELEIAELIVDRKTNAEIAHELFLSKKTVETHIRNIFRKLSATQRVEVARAVEREVESARGQRSSIADWTRSSKLAGVGPPSG